MKQPTKEDGFHLLDTNNDGLLTVEEWQAYNGSIVNFSDFLKEKDIDGKTYQMFAFFKGRRKK